MREKTFKRKHTGHAKGVAVAALLVGTALLAACAGRGGADAQNSERPFGLVPLEPSQYNSIPLAMVPPGGSLPDRVDLSADMPPVGRQGRQSSCVAWAVAYAVRSYLENRDRHWDAAATAHQFSPAFIYNQAARGNCNGGMTFVQALNILTSQGAATLAEMPYTDADCVNQPDEEMRQRAQLYRVAQYRRLNVQDPFEVKAHLASGFPVLVSVATDNTFMWLRSGDVWASKGATIGYHAVVLVGYDDSAHAFKLINSWGRDWGTDGYGWISYDIFQRVTNEAYIIAPFENRPEPTPEPEADNPPQPEPADYEQGIEVLDVDYKASSDEGLPGMNVRLKYTLVGYSGLSGQILLHFWYADGRPLAASSPDFSDVYGNAAIGTPVFSIEDERYVDYEFTTFVPYSSLAVTPGRQEFDGRNLVYRPSSTKLLMRADLFVDRFGVSQSRVVPFTLFR